MEPYLLTLFPQVDSLFVELSIQELDIVIKNCKLLLKTLVLPFQAFNRVGQFGYLRGGQKP